MIFLENRLRKGKRSSIRNQMRGYRHLKDTGQLDLLLRIKDDFSNTPLLSIAKQGRKTFFGAGIKNTELIVRQFIIFRFVNLKFNKTILEAIGKRKTHLVLPLPPEWRKILEQYGFVSDTWVNKFIWLGYILFYFAYGIAVSLKALFRGRSQFKSFPKDLKEHSVYFQSLTRNNLPLNKDQEKSYDIVSWYFSWKDKISNPSAILHSIKGVPHFDHKGTPVIFTESGVPCLEGLSQHLQYLWWIATKLPLAVIDFLRGNYIHALLFGEASNSAIVRIVNSSQLSMDYLFHNSGWIFRPLWTYDAEEKGARILFYFYSTNIENFKLNDGYGIQPYSWQIVSWSNYLVWDEYQADFIRRKVGNGKNIFIVGTIWFHESSVPVPKLPKSSVVVFDVQPHRDAQYQMHVVIPEYLVPDVVNKFLSDIQQAVRLHGQIMVLKRKRHLGNLLNKKYKFFVDKISAADDFISVDPDVSALSLIEQAELVISLPFTSTAIIAREQGKPSIFYDPSGIIQKDDRGAHGIQIVSGLSELLEWFEIFFIEKTNPVVNE